MPSKVFSRSMAALPRAVLWGIMPRTVRQNILEGARKWKGPKHGDQHTSTYPTTLLSRLNCMCAMGNDEKRTAASGVETGLLAHESRIFHYMAVLAAIPQIKELPKIIP